jgi:hypothetical protein
VYRDLNYKENESADMNGAVDNLWMAGLIEGRIDYSGVGEW